MSVVNLDYIFKPQRIAVVGASDDPTGVGYSVFHNLIGSGFQGVVYPVNPKREAIQGIQAYPDVLHLPKPPDLAVICTPARTVPGLVRQCGEIGTRGMVIISAGFREAGPEGRALEQQVLQEAKKFDNLRIIGPNCLGIIVPPLRLNLSFATDMPKAGQVAFISQSGALCTSVLDWALQEDIGFSYFVSIGNMIDVHFGDLMDYFGRDPQTKSMLMYIESISEARGFMSAARAFARTKPIIAYKSGRFAESAKAAASHTGAMAGEDAVYDAVFQRAGVVRIFEIDDLFECAELLARQRPPRGPRLAIVTNAGGPGVMATDALIARQGTLAQLAPETMHQLNQALPAFWSHNNPVDILGDAPPDRYAKAMEIVLTDPNVDAALVILTPQAMTDPTATAKAIAAAVTHSDKPVLTTWMGGKVVAEGIQVLNQAHVPTYGTAEQAVRAFMHLVSYARNLETLSETPRDIPVSFQLDSDKQQTLTQMLREEGEVISETTSKLLLEAYGIPIIRPYPAATADEAVRLAQQVGYPVVLKVQSPQITHKTDVGGVVLNLQTEAEVRAAFDRIVSSAKSKRPDADVQGVTVQRMLDTKHGFELIVGAKRDPTFGAILLVGMGGVTAEIFRDRALGLPPLNERLARRMLEALKSWPLLQGYRGQAGVNLDRLIEVIMRFSYLIAEHPEIKELDINPLLATAEDAWALDARVIIDAGEAGAAVKPYAHLAIRPYPQEYVRCTTLKDGTPVTLRPIRPEDELIWRDLINQSSAESLRQRFHYSLREATHELAARYCSIDYDRELAIVAEIEENGARKLLGGGRLIADPDHVEATYGVLVGDAWQGRGVGALLTDYCLQIAKDWGLMRVAVETLADNERAIAMFRNRGFELMPEVDGVIVCKKMVVSG